MDLPIESSIDKILFHLTLAEQPVPPAFPRKVLFWGEGAGEISSYVAGWMAGKGIDVIVLDGANRFNPYMVSSFARRALIPPEELLKSIRIARAFTCYQMATLMGEQLASLLKQEGTTTQLQRPWVILLGPLTTFLDEDVPEREVRPLFERALRKVEKMAMEGIPFFLFQPNPPNPPLVKGAPPSPSSEAELLRRMGKVRTLVSDGRRGFIDSRGSCLTKRLFQFSDLVWRIGLDDQEPKIILEKGLTFPKSLSHSVISHSMT